MPQLRIMICRAVKDGITPGSFTGNYKCKLCGDALALTFSSVEQLKAHPESPLLCNPCGIVFIEMGRDKIDRIELSPQAKKELERGNLSPLAESLRKGNHGQEN